MPSYRFQSEAPDKFSHFEDVLPDSQRYKDLVASGAQFEVAPVAGSVGPDGSLVGTLGAPTEPTTAPGTITSGPANDYVSKLSGFYDQEKAAAEERQKQMEQQRVARTADIESIFGAEQKRTEERQGEEAATNKTLQFRLGRADTEYGRKEIEKLNAEHSFQLSNLQAKKAQALNELNAAINDENFRAAAELQTTYKNLLKEEDTAKRQQQADYAALVSSQMEKAKFDLEVKKYEQQLVAKDKPIVVAPGSSIYDPGTGEFIGTAPKPADDKAPAIEKWGGQVHQWNPTSQKWETLGFEKESGLEDNNLISAANLISAGKAKLSDYSGD